jgi:hypothetical protein
MCMFCVCNSYIVKKFCMKNVYSNGEKKGKEKIGIVYFFFVFIINASSFFLSQGNVGEYYTFHYYTHIRVFCCVFCLQGFLCPGKILFVLFVIFFLRQTLICLTCSGTFIHVVNDLFFLLFSFIKSKFFFLLFDRFLYSSVRITQLHVLLTKNK